MEVFQNVSGGGNSRLCSSLMTWSGVGRPAGPGPPGRVRLGLGLQRLRVRDALSSVPAPAPRSEPAMLRGGGGGGSRGGCSASVPGSRGLGLASPLTVAVHSLRLTVKECSAAAAGGSLRNIRPPANEPPQSSRTALWGASLGAIAAAAPLLPAPGASGSRTGRVTPGSVTH